MLYTSESREAGRVSCSLFFLPPNMRSAALGRYLVFRPVIYRLFCGGDFRSVIRGDIVRIKIGQY